MGSGVSTLLPCFKPPPPSTAAHHRTLAATAAEEQLIFSPSDLITEETALGHSFCYVPSNRFLSPTPSNRFLSPTASARFSPARADPNPNPNTTVFRAISGASVSANTSTPRSVDCVYEDAAAAATVGSGSSSVVNVVGGFESTASFCALPLQPVPRGGDGFFLSGPMERGALSGPLESSMGGGSGRVNFSAPLGGVYPKKRKKRKGVLGLKKAICRDLSEKKRPWVVPVLNLVNRRENSGPGEEGKGRSEDESSSDVQWALGKAGEDRVHVVVSEEQGWLFVGIYDGFNGPDAPEFLMGHLYKAVYKELQGLFWEPDVPKDLGIVEQSENSNDPILDNAGEGKRKLALEGEENVSKTNQSIEPNVREDDDSLIGGIESSSVPQDRAKKVIFQSEGTEIVRRRKLWELLAEDAAEEGLDLSGSARFAFSVDDAISASNAGSAGSRRWLLLSKLKQGLSKHKDKKLFPWKFGLEGKQEKVEIVENVESSTVAEGRVVKRKRKVGPVDHELVLSALLRALEFTELAYLEMTDKLIDTNPELALMGSCLLVVLMRDEDVYVMNLGDSRAIVAQHEPQEMVPSMDDNRASTEGIIEGSTQAMRLTALQLSTDHSTSIEEVSSSFRMHNSLFLA